jgi:hypothetical protein
MLEAQLETPLATHDRETFFYVAPPIRPVCDAHALSTTIHEQMHPGVYKVALACWMGLLGIFALTFFSSANALFMVMIDCVYAAMFFGIPWVLHRLTPPSETRPRDFFSFLNGRLDTIYGPIRASEAFLQVILVPLCLGIGGIAIGLIIQSARTAF